MRKILLSFAALCCIVTSAIAAVGDKVYFVNEAGIDPVYVGEVNELWGFIAGANATFEGWQYGGKDVYSYTITSDEATRLYVNRPSDNEWIKNGDDGRFVNGRYYLIQTDNTYHWLTENYYNEFYFMDNNGGTNPDYTFGEAPYINLYNTNWAAQLNGSCNSVQMTSIGTVTKGENSYPGYKYIYLTSEPVAIVQFVKPSDTDKKIGPDVVAGKNYYSYWGWHTMDEVATPYLYYATQANGEGDWNQEAMTWDGTQFTLSRTNVLLSTTGEYRFRVLLSKDTWAAAYPCVNNDWNKSFDIAEAGFYNISYSYNPATDELTAAPSKNSNYYREVTNGNYGSLCLPYGGSYDNAVFYTVVGKEAGNIVLEEVEGNLVAGKPYFFKATGDWMHVWYSGDAVAAPLINDNNGLVGSFTEHTVAAGNYMLYQNQLWEVEGTQAKVGQYRCYLDMDAVPAANLAPGRNYIRMAINGENAATAIDNAAIEMRTVKTFENGQLIIIKNGVKYNAQGIIVK